ncbi:MAG: rRNA maturation RNase YbeY [Candidatus Acidiferrales bacterium]
MILNRQRRRSVVLAPLQEFTRQLTRVLRLKREAISVALVSDRAIARLNRRYRGRASATDVLSFPVSEGKGRNGYRGDVVISVETAGRNARRYRHSLEEEIKLLALHGALHLLGYDHETDRGQMNRREHQWRRRLGLE